MVAIISLLEPPRIKYEKIIMLSVLLIAYTPNKYDEAIVIENNIREFKIISINPPKHFAVDLVDVKSMDNIRIKESQCFVIIILSLIYVI